MGQQVSVETFTSSKDTDGYKYWTSFDPYPFKFGNRKLVYMGILNGNGPLQKQKCVVKTMREENVTQSEWLLESERASVAREMAIIFNRVVSNQDSKIVFNCPVVAEIDTPSDCLCISDILGKPNKKWRDSEHVSIELFLKGKFENFEYGWVSPERLIVPEAFSHFTWCRSDGSLLVSNLQGIYASHIYHCTGPFIHSTEMKYGGSDLGTDGIKSFFKLHKCNSICNNWPRLGDGKILPGCGAGFSFDDSLPNAPQLAVCMPPPPSYDDCEFETYTSNVTPGYEEGAVSPFSTDLSPRSEKRVMAPFTSDVLPRYEEYALAPYSTDLFPRHENRTVTPSSAGTSQFTEPEEKTWGTQAQLIRHAMQCYKPSKMPLKPNSDGKLVMDWRDEILSHAMMYGPKAQFNNPVFQRHILGMHTMLFVKQMHFTQPPAYCKLALPTNEIRQHKVGQKVRFADNDKYNDDDESDDADRNNCENFVLPPPYSESVNTSMECATYL